MDSATGSRVGRTMYPILGSYLGWLMDGYVTISYLIQEATITTLFFPGQLYIGYFFGFVVNGVARAVGALFLGNFIGDIIGRKRMIVVTILAFSFSSFSLGLLPTYAHIGILAPISMGIILFLMGLFAGAEYGGGTALSMESVSPEKRNLMGAFVQSGFGTGYALLSLVYFVLTSVFQSNFNIIGWRVLFYTTLIPGLAAFGIRYLIPESKVFSEAKSKGDVSRIPVASLLVESWRKVLLILVITAGLLFVNTATFSLYPTILESVDGFSGPSVGLGLAVINLISIGGIILGGSFAKNSVERLKFILRYTALFVVINFIVVFFVFSHNAIVVYLAFSVQAFFEAMIFSTLPAFMAEAFSKRYRTTGVGFVYNLGATLGTTALVMIPLYANSYGWSVIWLGSITAALVAMLSSMVVYGRGIKSARPREDAIAN